MAFPVVRLSGSPKERGAQYAEQAAAAILRTISNYKKVFAARRSLDWSAACEEALRFQPYLIEHAPHLLEEMQGIAEGVGVDLATIIALNVRTELLAGVPPMAEPGAFPPPGPVTNVAECSAV